MLKSRLVIALAICAGALVSPAAAHLSVTFHAAPDAIDNADCSPANPCSAQGAIGACHKQQIQTCQVLLADGVYLDPAINIYYYRAVVVTGNCNRAGAVVLRATKDSSTLIKVQDHAIGIVECLALESTGQGTIALTGRQNAIVDYKFITFGEMRGGHQIAIVEHSTASCIGPNTISGGASVHAVAADMSKLNMGCHWSLPRPVAFNYFLNAVDFSKINAQGAIYTGDVAESTGIKCNARQSVVYAPFSELPGDQDGNCENILR